MCTSGDIQRGDNVCARVYPQGEQEVSPSLSFLSLLFSPHVSEAEMRQEASWREERAWIKPETWIQPETYIHVIFIQPPVSYRSPFVHTFQIT